MFVLSIRAPDILVCKYGMTSRIQLGPENLTFANCPGLVRHRALFHLPSIGNFFVCDQSNGRRLWRGCRLSSGSRRVGDDECRAAFSTSRAGNTKEGSAADTTATRQSPSPETIRRKSRTTQAAGPAAAVSGVQHPRLPTSEGQPCPVVPPLFRVGVQRHSRRLPPRADDVRVISEVRLPVFLQLRAA